MNQPPRTRAELQDDPLCPYRQEMHVERVGAAIQRDTMRRAICQALAREVT
ncbi:MAG TPA: hypothetical protein VM537_03795 [Anaerolineae bacterium]|nr:hypothetical protein [Anaerolineae bacterium]